MESREWRVGSYQFTVFSKQLASSNNSDFDPKSFFIPHPSSLILLLHGFTGSRKNWFFLAPKLVELGYTVVVPDILGHGESDAPEDAEAYRMERITADILSHFPQPITVLGYSMGGRLALYMAVNFPEKVNRLILESSSPGLADSTERQARIESDNALADLILENGIEAFVNRWEAVPLFASQKRLPAERQKGLRAQRLGNRPIGLANSLRGMGTGQQPSLWDDLDQLQIPILLLAGDLDRKFVAIGKQMLTQLPNANLQIIEDAGHTIHFEKPTLYAKLMCEWLS